MSIVFICGNGNITFEEFQEYYVNAINLTLTSLKNYSYILGDFRGVDTLVMEYLKDKTMQVEICHLFNKPRYFPDKFKTFVEDWKITGGFQTNAQRDRYMIEQCTHFIAIDKNTDQNRVSGTYKNIELCKKLCKMRFC